MGILDAINQYKADFRSRRIEKMEDRAKREKSELEAMEKERLAAKNLANIQLKKEAAKAEISRAKEINFRNTAAGQFISAGKSMMAKLKEQSKQGNSIFKNESSRNPFYDTDKKEKKKKNPFYD